MSLHIRFQALQEDGLRYDTGPTEEQEHTGAAHVHDGASVDLGNSGSNLSDSAGTEFLLPDIFGDSWWGEEPGSSRSSSPTPSC